jgi:hypothetical protein
LLATTSLEQPNAKTKAILFKTSNGNFFAQYQTLLPGEINKIAAVDINEAISLYQSLRKKEVPFRVVFTVIQVEDG